MIGVDEVGRGCLAGPLLVVAARATSDLPKGLKDSKLLSRKQRVKLLDLLSNRCNFGEGWVEAYEIDRHGLAGGLRLGVERALAALGAEAFDEIIIDGKVNYAPPAFTRVNCIVKADSLVPLVSAAGIYAKVRRDEHMSKLTEQYPEYGFESHAGYGTNRHLLALKSSGPIKNVHRMSFRPLLSLKEEI